MSIMGFWGYEGMDIGNCPKCGRVYVKNFQGVCPNCIKELELQYEKCLKYLRENRSCSIHELSEATEVSVNQIMKFIREGRISIKNNPNMAYACESCGTSIREGHLCETCRQRLVKNATNMMEDEEIRRRLQEDKRKGTSYNIKDKLFDSEKK